MIFTNGDLKRLKERFDLTDLNDDYKIPALLARLEAAEACLAFHFDATDCQCGKCIAWRKSKGKMDGTK